MMLAILSMYVTKIRTKGILVNILDISMKEFFIYVVSANISQPQNQALGSILKLSMKVLLQM